MTCVITILELLSMLCFLNKVKNLNVFMTVSFLWFYQIKCVESPKFDIKIAKIRFWAAVSTPAPPTVSPLYPHWVRHPDPPSTNVEPPHLSYPRSGPV